jgi:hypothetical protein
VTAHDPTSQIVAQLSENSPLVTGKNKRVGVSSARLNPATRVASRRGEAWRGEAGGGGGPRVDVPLVLMLIHIGKEPPL